MSLTARYQEAIDCQNRADAARNSSRESHLEEWNESLARANFWKSMAEQTGLTEEQIRRLL